MITLAADVGGTFTDLLLVDPDRGLALVDKTPTGPRGSADGVALGVARMAAKAGIAVGDIGLFVHGFTVATNAFLMRTGARAALVATEGFGDVLEIGGQMRPRTYALAQSRPAPVVPRARVVEVRERIDAFGAVMTPLDAAEIDRVAAALAAMAPESVAVSLAFSFLNPAHEAALAAAIAEALPGVPVYPSSAVNPQLEEWPRASTTAMAAYLGPVVARYLDALDATLARIGFRGALRLMRSDGGVATPRAARANPGHMLASGLAGGVIAAERLCRRLGVAEAVTLDVGGTSADFAAITGGAARTRTARTLDGQPLRLPTIDVETLSNGGGSIAWVDPGGALRVGPQSAGAVPGPACYGAGGESPTVTDAAVVLGWLAPEDYLGGEARIDPGLAAEAVDRGVARPLGLSLGAAAFGVIRVANAMLVQSIRALSVERGLDPRRFALVAFGGAGPLYGGMIARDLGVAEVLVPRRPGVFAAEGLLAADIRHAGQAPFRAPLAALDGPAMAAALAALAGQAEAELAADGVPPDRRALRFAADLRYVGQFHELPAPLPPGAPDAAALAAAFHRVHAERYGHADPAAPVEIVNLRVEAAGRLDAPEPPEDAAPAAAAPSRLRPVSLDGGPAAPVPVHARAALGPGAVVCGPAIVAQADSTTLVLPGQTATVAAGGVLRIREARA